MGANLEFCVWQLAQEAASCYVWRGDLGQGQGAGSGHGDQAMKINSIQVAGRIEGLLGGSMEAGVSVVKTWGVGLGLLGRRLAFLDLVGTLAEGSEV